MYQSSFAAFPAGWTTTGSLALASFVGMLGSFFSNIFGWYVTGINPDQSSIHANARQNAVLSLRDTFDELSYELIDLYKVDKQSCRVLTARLDIDVIKARASQCGVDDVELHNIFRAFEAVCIFITQGILPRQHLLVNYITSKHGLFENETAIMSATNRQKRSNSLGPTLASAVETWLAHSSGSSLPDIRLVVDDLNSVSGKGKGESRLSTHFPWHPIGGLGEKHSLVLEEGEQEDEIVAQGGS